MAKQSRRDLLLVLQQEYLLANFASKQAILDAYVGATGYHRKYATKLLGNPVIERSSKRIRQRRYDEEVQAALIQVWNATNKVCAKRLVPFLPVMVPVMERGGYIKISEEVRLRLMSMSAATADRILSIERKRHGGKSLSLTKAGGLMKKHIPIRTFADWNEKQPGFLEIDCVAHCGSSAKGAFLSTLTMTDIYTGWTELLALEQKTGSAVAAALSKAACLLPFPIRGLDSDNGAEFINFTVVSWCEAGEVNFTRSREYKKNDQAHVEEKNGSIVRRFTGYDRFTGAQSLRKLEKLYESLRLYVNYFQPSMKLSHKQRDGAHVRKEYEVAATPCQRILNSNISEEVKTQVRAEFESLDPVSLLGGIERLQQELWQTAVSVTPQQISRDSLIQILSDDSDLPRITEGLEKHRRALSKRQLKPKVIHPTPALSDTSIARNVRTFLSNLKEGREFAFQDIQHLGSRGAIHNALAKLTREGKLLRIATGQYRLLAKLEIECSSVASQVRIYLAKHPNPFSIKELLHLGSRRAVETELTNLVKNKKIQRIKPGKYQNIPILNR